MLIYLVRHGQTPGNKEKRLQSPTTPLAPEGEIQAQKLAERLSKITLDELWSSPMTRAYQTAEFINAYHHLEIKKEPLLAELKRATSIQGELILSPRHKDVSQIFEKKTDFDPYYRFEDGESFVDMVERCHKLVKLLAQHAGKVSEDHILAIATHGIILATLFEVILLGDTATPEILVSALRRIRTENTGITVIKVDQAGQWRIVTFNDYAHL